ncbi:MAG: 16S rRNA (cytosine(967)-C(5))-methyltransferase RsmB [Tissierellia bacterium]|nr:16S rRNA (cytosine(967)-C(5))-methyltransferase RsmB [Tissierellia bacterium]
MNGRKIALDILMDMGDNGSFSNHVINRYLEGEKSVRDRNLVRELVYGVLENRIYIDYIISRASNIGIEKIQPRVLEILRMGIYQIAFMDRIPDRAAINEAVNLSKWGGHKGISGYVNGVLRNVSRNIERLMKIEVIDREHALSIKYSHPLWMIRRWIEDYGYEFTKQLCKYNNHRPRLNIRTNTIKITRRELRNRLAKYGYTVNETKHAADGLIVENPSAITEIEEFKLGYFFIQDESSMLVAQIANPKGNNIVLDLCSAPGGKATHFAELMNDRGKIIGRDIYDHKLRLIDENAARLGITIIETQKFDAMELDKAWIGKADYCIVDAPCSGLGIIRRRPEIKWNRNEDDIEDLVRIQSGILDNAKMYIKPDGIIIYSTCTIGRQENIDIVEEFIHKNPGFELMNFHDRVNFKQDMQSATNGYIELFPHIHHMDGFFIAKIRRKDG